MSLPSIGRVHNHGVQQRSPDNRYLEQHPDLERASKDWAHGPTLVPNTLAANRHPQSASVTLSQPWLGKPVPTHVRGLHCPCPCLLQSHRRTRWNLWTNYGGAQDAVFGRPSSIDQSWRSQPVRPSHLNHDGPWKKNKKGLELTALYWFHVRYYRSVLETFEKFNAFATKELTKQARLLQS